MHEVVSIQIGQCGNQVGNEFWRRIANEHGINENGRCNEIGDDRRNKFFYQTEGGLFVPRAVLMDLEPRVIGQCMPFFSRDSIFVSRDGCGAGNNWAHGYCAANKARAEICDLVRREVEACDGPEAINIMHSVAGGTGSGGGSLLVREIRDMFPKKIISSYSILPTNEEGSDVVVQPYNSILALAHLQEFCDSICVMDNHALNAHTINNLINATEDDSVVNFNAINALASTVIAASNSSLRFPSHVFCNSRSILNCTVPLPSYKFLIPSYSPFAGSRYVANAGDVMRRLILPKSRLCAYEDSKTHASLAMFNILEGPTNPSEIARTAEIIRAKNNFVSWAPPFFQVALSNRPLERPCGLALNNTTGITFLLDKIILQFDRLRRRNAFIDIYKKYDQNLEIFDSSREVIQKVVDDYKKCEVEKPN